MKPISQDTSRECNRGDGQGPRTDNRPQCRNTRDATATAEWITTTRRKRLTCSLGTSIRRECGIWLLVRVRLFPYSTTRYLSVFGAPVPGARSNQYVSDAKVPSWRLEISPYRSRQGPSRHSISKAGFRGEIVVMGVSWMLRTTMSRTRNATRQSTYRWWWR